ncbi:non-ribosomal peptide synthetase, partial [Virgisporangium aurantiacum]|uniref:non-ribosomal peptide synthetase n=1 Tax=Virgisporangium aurantiacum TaxID=175570 RepID=UPI00194E08BA
MSTVGIATSAAFADGYPLTPIQQGLLFHSLREPGSGAYVEQLSMPFTGRLDVAALGRAWEHVTSRHPVLRTAVVWEDVPNPLQLVMTDARVPIRCQDWRAATPAEREQRFARMLADDRALGFDLSVAPLLRVTVLRLGEREYRMVLTHHHVVLDGWSVPIVLDEVVTSYRAFVEGRQPELPSRRPFRDYVAWLQTRDLPAAEAYWRRAMEEVTAPTSLAVDTARDRDNTEQPEPGQAHAELRCQLPEALSHELTAFTRRHRLTLSTIVRGAWALLLARYSGEDLVVFGATVSGRPPELTGSEDMVGMFINTVPVPVHVTPGARLVEWLTELQDQLLRTEPFAHVSLVDIHRWSRVPPGMALFDSIIVVENFPGGTPSDAGRAGHDDLILTYDGSPLARSHYPITLAIGAGEPLDFAISYLRARFDRSTVERMAGHVATLLAAMAADPHRRLADVDVLTTDERADLLRWNDTTTEVPARLTPEIVTDQATRTPHAPAVIAADGTLTYGGLDRRANQLAQRLRALGVAYESVVGVCLEPGLDTAVAFLGVLKAGGTYLPINFDDPPERRTSLLDGAHARLLISQRRLVESGRSDLRGQRLLLCLDDPDHTGAIDAASPTPPRSAVRPESLAYAIYTSGSTGRPKAVMVTHGGLSNLIGAQRRLLCVGPEDRVAQFAAAGFDASVWEMVMAFGSGAALVVVSAHARREVGELVAELIAGDVTIATLPPSLLGVLDAGRVPGLGTVVAAGERLPAEVASAWSEGRRLINAYGPTETAVCATATDRIRPMSPAPTIGGPVANTACHVLDRHLRAVAVGVPGELYIAGAGLARGYLGRTGLTAERFVADPFAADGSRMYRTGDRVRRLADGNLDFLGRVDDQIKVRGYRIEPAEIEAALAVHPGVGQAAVTVRTDTADLPQLIAYVVAADPSSAPETGELLAFLATRLPRHLVPDAVTALPRLPLSANGKVDRRALPAPRTVDATPAREPVAPRSPTEEMIAGIWADVLGLDTVGGRDNFLNLGGHSLLATRMVSRVRSAFGRDIRLADFFAAPALTDFASAVDRAAHADLAAPLVSVPRDGPLPLSFSQQRMWFLHRMRPDSGDYNVPIVVRLIGRLDTTAVARAITEIAARHEVLRTRYVSDNGVPGQIADPPAPVPLPVDDLTASAVGDPIADARRLVAAEVSRPFDLAAAAPLRARLFRLAVDDHVLALTLHHIACDEWSAGILRRELSTLYAAFCGTGEAELTPLPVQYGDYATWQRAWLRGDVLDEQTRYWRERLDGASVTELPTDRPRRGVYSGAGELAFFDIPAAVADRLRAVSRQNQVTMFMTLLAGFKVLLARYCGQRDIVVGTPVAGRTGVETEDLIGFFVNTLVLRTDLSGDPAFTDVLARVRQTALGAYTHQDVPFEQLVERLQPDRDLSRHPLFQVVLSFDNTAMPDPTLGETQSCAFAVPWQTSRFDMTVALSGGPTGGPLTGAVEYSSDLFDRATVECLLGHYANVLAAVAVDPSRRMSQVDLLGTDERRRIVTGWNDTASAGNAHVHELVDAQACLHPDSVAVVHRTRHVTYGTLMERADHLAHRLAAAGVGPEKLVGIAVPRSIDLVVALLAVAKAGGAALPLDPDYPEQRLSWMFADAGAGVLISDRDAAPRLGALADRVIVMDADTPADAVHQRLPRPDGDSLAYVMYTSGSTGTPKAAAVCHRGFANAIRHSIGLLGVAPGTTVLQTSPSSFDPCLQEVFTALAAGATLHVVDRETIIEPGALARLARRIGARMIGFTPSGLQTLDSDAFPGVTTVMVGGEPCPTDLAATWADGRALHNVYGATEAAIYSMSFSYPPDDRPASTTLPVGRPIHNSEAYVLDPWAQPTPIGVTGEVYLGGAGVGRGYLGRPGLTADRFVAHPFAGDGSRLYRTGDLGRYLPDGTIQLLGRLDDQVKVRGYRIEPGEVEAAIATHPHVAQAAVRVDIDSAGRRRLVGYLTPAAGTPVPTTDQLRTFASTLLPEHMIPSVFVPVPELPHTPTGKVDRAALPPPETVRPDLATGYQPPRTPTEQLLADLWAELLRVERPGIRDNFFHLGGHSLLATQLIARIQTTWDVELPLAALFDHPVLGDLATVIDGGGVGSMVGSVVGG